MPDFWLDSNVFIEGKKGPYGFDIAPRFWNLIDELIEDGRIACPVHVHQELLEGQDEIEEWAKKRRHSGLFVDPTDAVQEEFVEIASYVTERYRNKFNIRRFLGRANPWVIAHAITDKSTVVTLETRVPSNSQKVKIPNVCEHFTFECVNTYEMLRQLGASWSR